MIALPIDICFFIFSIEKRCIHSGLLLDTYALVVKCLSSYEMDTVTWAQILDEAICILHEAINFEET